MKRNVSAWSGRYLAALQIHLKHRPQSSLETARGLGRQALAIGLETLDVFGIHKRALAALAAFGGQEGLVERAEAFLAEVLSPIEEGHHAAPATNVRLNRLNEMLDRRTLGWAAANRSLKRGIIQRKTAEAELRRSGKRYAKLLRESHRLQEHMRRLTHKIFSAQETERHAISHQLQDETAQTLVGISVRLLTLKKAAKGNTADLKKEIASTQRLVQESVQSINRFARELDIHHPSSIARRSIDCDTPRKGGAELSASAGLANRIMKKQDKPERRQEKSPVKAVRQHLLASPVSVSFPVIAMAASAGGLKALSVILGDLPADFPAAIAIVMHLSPEHKSLLAEILNSRTRLRVKQAHTGDMLCHSSVFIAPPNHHLFVVKGGRLRLSSSASQKVHYARPSAEPLFASVAEVYKKNAIAVVLTGGDGDGSFGVRIIKEKGGKVIAQDRPTSQDFSMPETAIKTGEVDFILPLEEIAPKLIELVGAAEKKGRVAPATHPFLAAQEIAVGDPREK